MMIWNRGHTGGFTIPPAYEGRARATMAGLVGAALSLTWLLPRSAALRFTLSDVQFLFPAPLSRRELLRYKVVRLLMGAAAMALPLTLIMGPVRIGAALLFYAKAAAIGGVVALHEAGVSLYRLNARDSRGLRGGRRATVFAANAAMVVASVWILTRFAFASTAADLLPSALLVILAAAAQIAWILTSDAAFEEDAAVISE